MEIPHLRAAGGRGLLIFQEKVRNLQVADFFSKIGGCVGFQEVTTITPPFDPRFYVREVIVDLVEKVGHVMLRGVAPKHLYRNV
jgi:hypothetical protein